MQEHRVERLASRSGQAERHVGNAQHGSHAGHGRLYKLYALYRLDAVAPALLHAGADRENEGIEEKVLRQEPITPHGQVINRLGSTQLPFRGAGLPVGVDAGAYDRGPVLTCERQEAVEACALGVAFFEVDRVDKGFAGDVLQAALDDRRFGRVEHERQRRLSCKTARDLGHVRDAVFPGVIDAHVE